MDILVCDDNRAIRMLARAVLEREGHTVSLASTGADAVALAVIRPFGAAVLDIMMPGMDGMRAAGRIRALPHTPVLLALTSHSSPSDVQRYLHAGFDGVMAKPLSPGDFDRAMDLIDSGRPALVGVGGARDAAADTVPLVDMAVLAQGLGQAEPEMAASILRHFRFTLQECVRRMRAALPGAVGGEAAAVAEFRDALHAVRSASATIGLARVPALAGRLRNLPATDLRLATADLLRAVKQSLPALQAGLRSLGLGQGRAAVEVGGQHQAEPAHDDQHHRPPVGHER